MMLLYELQIKIAVLIIWLLVDDETDDDKIENTLIMQLLDEVDDEEVDYMVRQVLEFLDNEIIDELDVSEVDILPDDEVVDEVELDEYDEIEAGVEGLLVDEIDDLE